MLLKINPDNPQKKAIHEVVDCLKNGGVIIYPTDSVYGMGCDLYNSKAVHRICQIKGIKPEKSNFSIICQDLSNLSKFSKQINNPVYKLMNRTLPGPFTFILPATNLVPKLFKSKKKTIGIRVPKHNIPLQIVSRLGNPIVSTSIYHDDEILEYATDPKQIHDKYHNLVDFVIDGGYGNNIPTTVIDISGGKYEIIRQGLGILDE